ncbi:MAG: ABC transporter ATP-binding protein [Candidatus Bathyarchaeia archaeon]
MAALTAIVFLVGSVLSELMLPKLIQRLVDEGISRKEMNVILGTGITMIGIALLEALLTIGNTFLSVKTAQSFAADIRRLLFRKIQTFSFGNLDKFQTGQLIVRLTSDVNTVQQVVLLSLRMLVRAPLMITLSIALMLSTNVELARIVLLLLPLTLVGTAVFVTKAQPMFLEVQRRLERLNMVLQENLSGIRLVKAFVREDYENQRFDRANAELKKQSEKVGCLLSFLMPLMFLVVNLSILSVLWLGGQQVVLGKFTVGEIMAFTNYLLSSMFPLLMLGMIAGQMSAATASANRICEILDSKPDVVEKPSAIVLKDVKGRVAFEDVCFSYDRDSGEPALSDINLVVEPGETVAILGATGSGKSTLINLIPRFYDVTAGRVTIDGIDVRDVTLESLRSNIGIALQEVVLFSGTIRDNIKYGRPDASDEEVEEAARAAQIHDFIMSLPEGYDSIVGQRGVNLSGGQKQRIAIARALLVKPKILILDDSTSSVDIETEGKIQEAIRQLMYGRTCFVIAQRVSTVLTADRIIVLDRGRIAAEGTHQELMRSSQIYREIYESQLGEGGL